MSGSEDETWSQCLGDNQVFEEQPRAAAAERKEACGWGVEPLNFLPARVGCPERRRAAPQAISMQEPRAPVLEGLPADLAPLSPEKSPEREDVATAVTQYPARRKQTLPSSMPSFAAAPSPSCPLF